MTYLIVNADDFGFSPQINQGIRQAYLNGVVTDASMLICSPFAAEAVEIGRETGLPVGIHIDFVSPYVGDHTSCLGPEGRCVHELFLREFNKKIGQLFSAEELILFRDEIRRQIDIFEKMAGRRPSHLSYHFGLHFLPDIMAIYLMVAEEYQLPVRWGEQYAGRNPYYLAPDIFCDGFRGVNGCDTAAFLSLIERPWEGVMEVCCHPGYVTPSGLPDGYNRERETELKVLTDPGLKLGLEKRGVFLVSFEWLKDQLRLKAYNDLKKV
jgi:chitin disaccharide deacetylase